MKIGESDINN